ncbi:AraC family transcriptional regulator [Aliiglaciecola sp. M165]|uniref:AraC family transcriptional regulator n=1 Tax=Aliiglaciecola sp. M165 TaxID=2593649 RepID=UPI00117DC5BE|nr:AraC family transcriptional regulator [Aliiglaciecola sp. M165]TRY33207.1 helix-turn-helix transcriptional regulator [Aliiglaciecola sp. M165]
MTKKYQEVYPEPPLVNSQELLNATATELLHLEFFEAEPGEMPSEVFSQHHILVNLKEENTRVENWRDGEHRDFIFHKNEIVVTPAGIRSGWKWHEKSKVIVITLEPAKLEKFATSEVGILLNKVQLKSIPQFIDDDITQAAILLMEALHSKIGSAVMFESFTRIFLVKLIQKYGLESDDDISFNSSFTSKHYKRVLDYIAQNFGSDVNVEDLATQAGLSTAHFARLFKQTIGHTPHQFVMAYRIEQSKKMLSDIERPKIDIALSCGFSDQAHFSRVFKQIIGITPKEYRMSILKN